MGQVIQFKKPGECCANCRHLVAVPQDCSCVDGPPRQYCNHPYKANAHVYNQISSKFGPYKTPHDWCTKYENIKGIQTHAHRNILVVDDDPCILEILHDVLEQSGYACRIADNGTVGLAIFREQPFDIVIANYMMPGLNGFELMKRIKEILPSTPVIIISGYATRDDSLKAGANDFLKKPFKVGELKDCVNRALGVGQG